MDIQPILNKVLDAGLYAVGRREFMCPALDDALRMGIITKDEKIAAWRQIHQYISSINPDTGCLVNCFDVQGHFRRGAMAHNTFPARLGDFVSGQGLAIFKDWANRPMP